MCGYIKENIQNEEIDYSYIGLIAQKIKIGIIGGQRAAYIKAAHFLRNSCNVEIVAMDFSEEVLELQRKYENKLKLMKKKFDVGFLNDKHIIVIALHDCSIINEVEKFCNDNYRIFINCVDFKEGMGVIPVEIKGKNITVSLNSKGANPKGMVMVGKQIKKVIDDYDDFIGFSSIIRSKGKNIKKYKKTILEIIGDNRFKEYYDKGKAEEYLKKYFDDSIVEYLLKT